MTIGFDHYQRAMQDLRAAEARVSWLRDTVKRLEQDLADTRASRPPVLREAPGCLLDAGYGLVFDIVAQSVYVQTPAGQNIGLPIQIVRCGPASASDAGAYSDRLPRYLLELRASVTEVRFDDAGHAQEARP